MSLKKSKKKVKKSRKRAKIGQIILNLDSYDLSDIAHSD